MTETKRILTIDGGGLRGVFSAAIIEQMEKANPDENGNPKPAWQIFDCFCGTSAGSFLAAGLAHGLSATTLKEAFLQLGGGAFEEGDGTKFFEQHLKEIFKDAKPSQAKRRLAIPARDMARGRVIFFGNFPEDQHPEPSFWDESGIKEDAPMWEIVRRSTALPPFFEPAGDYLDGGVSPFANPAYAAYIGVQRRLGWNPHQQALKFYSVGTGYHRHRMDKLATLEKDQLYPVMVDAMMQDINFLQHQIMKRRKKDGKIWYKRYNLSFDEKSFKRFGLSTEGATLAELASTGNAPVEKLAEIGTKVGQILVKHSDFDPGDPAEERRGKERRTQTQAWPAKERRRGSDRRQRIRTLRA